MAQDWTPCSQGCSHWANTKPYSSSTSQSGKFRALLGGVSYCEGSPRRVLDWPWPLVWLGGNLRNFVIASRAGIYHWKCSLYHWHKENCFAFDDIFEMVWKNLDIFIRKSIKPKQMVSCCFASFFICSLAIHHPSHPPWTQQRQRLAWEQKGLSEKPFQPRLPCASQLLPLNSTTIIPFSLAPFLEG